MRFDVKKMVLLHLLAAGLFLSWFAGCWQQLDEAVFLFFNQQLESRRFAWFVARANQRWMDFVTFTLMSLIILHHLYRTIGYARLRAICLVVVMACCFSLQVSVGKVLPIQRDSPTHVLEGAIQLADVVPRIQAKYASSNSFPSDHGIGLGTFLLFAVYRFPRRYLAVVLPVVAVFSMPRVMSGAHWLTDILSGSVPLALITAAWLFYTPLSYWLIELISSPIEERLRQVL